MAFNIENWCPIGGESSDGPRMFAYVGAPDVESAIHASGYFNPVADQLTNRTLIYVISETTTCFFKVSSNSFAPTVTTEILFSHSG